MSKFQTGATDFSAITEANYPPVGSFIIGIDLDGSYKQMDSTGAVTAIGGASVLPSMMTEIILYGTSGILFPLYSQSVDKILVTKIDISAGESPRSNLTSFPSLDEFVSLIELTISDTNLTSLPSLNLLVSLQSLSSTYNQLTILQSLDNLVNLQFLNCGGNLLPSLPSLDGLINLQYLFCSNNQLTPEAISQALIDLDENGVNNGDFRAEAGTNAGYSQLTEAGLIAYNNLTEPIVLDEEDNYVSGRGWSISMNE